jgi:lysophospholipase
LRVWMVLAASAAIAGCGGGVREVSDEREALTSAAPISPAFHGDFDRLGYQAAIDEVVLPYCLPFLSAGNTSFTPGTFGAVRFGKFTGAAGKQLAYGVYPAAKERAAMVLLPGRTEPFAKYCEFLYDLRNSGITVYAMDLRGQGWSERLLADPEKGYVDAFDSYVADIKTFRDTIVMAAPHAKTVLFGHSTGGGAATLYLEKYPYDFDRAILSSPMNQINTAPYPEPVAEGLASLLVLLQRGEDYAPGELPYGDNDQFVDNRIEHSLARWTMMRRQIDQFPELTVGGATVNWVHESIEATFRMKAFAWAITTPYLLLQARHDEIVINSGQDLVCNLANWKGAICTKVTFGDPALSTADCDAALKRGDVATLNRCAGHELFMERDTIRAQFERAISDYLDQLTR